MVGSSGRPDGVTEPKRRNECRSRKAKRAPPGPDNLEVQAEGGGRIRGRPEKMEPGRVEALREQLGGAPFCDLDLEALPGGMEHTVRKIAEIGRRAAIGPEELPAWVDWAAEVTKDSPGVRDGPNYFLAVLHHGLAERDSDQPPQLPSAESGRPKEQDIAESRYLHIYR